MSDEELLRKIARGDDAAFREFYARTAPWLAVRLRRRCRDDQLVAEALQDTFLAVWRTAASFGGTGTAAGWLWTIAVRRLIDALRRHSRQERVPPVAFELAAPAAEDEALSGSLDDELSCALRDLAPELRQVLRALVLDGLSVRETAELLGLPAGTVKTRARRARLMLRRAIAT